MEKKNLNALFSSVNDILKEINVDKIDPNAPDFENLPEGYYPSEVIKGELTESKSGKPQVKLQLKTTADGLKVVIDEEGDAVFETVPKSSNRFIFKYYPLSTKSEVEKFIKDMLKFEGEEPGIPLLERDYFTNSELLVAALEVLVGSRIYTQITVSKNKEGQESAWTNLISWERAENLGLLE